MSFRTLALLTLCLSLTVAYADWNALSADNSSEIQTKILSSSDSELKLEVTVPGYQLTCTKVDGKECCVIRIPGASSHQVKGFPMLPMWAHLVKINNFCNAKLEVISKEVVEVALKNPVIPSKGHLTRDIDPESVAYEFGPIYSENAFYVTEKDQISIGQEFIMHNVRGVRLEVMPISVNHVTMKMNVLKKIVLAVKCEGLSTKNLLTTTNTQVSSTMDEIFAGAFINHTASALKATSRNSRLIAVVPAQFQSLITDWVSFKSSKGYDVTVKTITNETGDQVKGYLQQQFDANHFEYVVLFGDVDTMPYLTGKYESAAADRCYVRLAGDDNYPDAFISRISGNGTQITNQLNKILKYEKSPKPGTWWKKGVTIASPYGNPSDTQRAQWVINGGDNSGEKVAILSGGLKGINYSSFSENYGDSASASNVASAVNSGVGIICYIGHGSETSWVTTGFNVNNASSLTNGEMLPTVWSVACVNGKFTVATCFAEAWLRNPNGGAVAMEASSTNEAWDPPVTHQAAIVNAYIQSNLKTFGAIEGVGCVAGLKNWGDADSTEGNQLAEQINLFGDCTMEVRYPTKADQSSSGE